MRILRENLDKNPRYFNRERHVEEEDIDIDLLERSDVINNLDNSEANDSEVNDDPLNLSVFKEPFPVGSPSMHQRLHILPYQEEEEEEQEIDVVTIDDEEGDLVDPLDLNIVKNEHMEIGGEEDKENLPKMSKNGEGVALNIQREIIDFEYGTRIVKVLLRGEIDKEAPGNDDKAIQVAENHENDVTGYTLRILENGEDSLEVNSNEMDDGPINEDYNNDKEVPQVVENIEMELEDSEVPEPPKEPEPEILFEFHGDNPLLKDKILRKVFGYLQLNFNQVKAYRLVCKKWNNYLQSRLEARVNAKGHRPIPLLTIDDVTSFNRCFKGKRILRMIFSRFIISYNFLQRDYLDSYKGSEVRSFIKNFSTQIKDLTIFYPRKIILFPKILRGSNFPNVVVLRFDWDEESPEVLNPRKYLTPVSKSEDSKATQMTRLKLIKFQKTSDVFISGEFYRQLSLLAPNLEKVTFPKLSPLDRNPIRIFGEEQLLKLTRITLRNVTSSSLKTLIRLSEESPEFCLISLKVTCDPHLNYEATALNSLISCHAPNLEILELCSPIIENSLETELLEVEMPKLRKLRLPVTSSIQIKDISCLAKQFPSLELISNCHKVITPYCYCWNFESDITPELWAPISAMETPLINLKCLEINQPIPNLATLEAIATICPNLESATFFVDTSSDVNNILWKLWTLWPKSLTCLTLVFVGEIVSLDSALTGINPDKFGDNPEEMPTSEDIKEHQGFFFEGRAPSIHIMKKLEKLMLIKSFKMSGISVAFAFEDLKCLKTLILNRDNHTTILPEDCQKTLRLVQGIDLRLVGIEPNLIIDFNPKDPAYEWLCMF